MDVPMYKMKPIFTPETNIELPSCMYRLKNLHNVESNAQFTNAPRQNDERQSSPSEIAKVEAVQEDILLKLSNLKNKLEQLKKMVKEPPSKPAAAPTPSSTTFSSTYQDVAKLPEIVVAANPSLPPYGLLALRSIWLPEVDTCLSTHSHSSLKRKVAKHIDSTFNTPPPASNVPTLRIRIIWSNVSSAEVTTSPAKQVIKGEVNILRLLSRLGPSNLNIDSVSSEEAAAADSLLDQVHCWSTGSLPNSALSKLAPAGSSWLLKGGPSIADIALWSYLKSDKQAKLPPKLAPWLQNCDKKFK